MSADAEVNGTRLHYEVAGSGFPVVLIHGFCADLHVWDFVFEELAQQCQTIRYDVRGFGKSAVPTDQQYTHPDDLKALLDHLQIKEAHIIGQSMGGEIAVEFALTYPKSTRSLMLVDSALGGYAWSSAYNKSFESVGAIIQQSGWQAGADALMKHPMHIPCSERPAAASRLRQILKNYSGWVFTHTDPRRLLDPPAIEQLDSINAPTLVISAERSLPDFHEIADILVRNIPDAYKVKVNGSGHVIPLEAPEKLTSLMLDFLAD